MIYESFGHFVTYPLKLDISQDALTSAICYTWMNLVVDCNNSASTLQNRVSSSVDGYLGMSQE